MNEIPFPVLLNVKMNFIELLSKMRTYLMGCAIIMILFFHNLWVRDIIWLKPINYFGDFGVDIFLFVSGFGIVHSLMKNDLKVFFFNRFIRIIPLCLICGVAKVAIFHFVLKDDSHWTWRSLIGFDLWYIKAILFLYLISPLLFKYLKKNGFFFLLFSYVLAIVMLRVVSNQTVCLLLPRIPIYLLGMMVGVNMITVSRKLIVVSSIFFLCAVAYRLFFITYSFGNPYDPLLFISIGVFFLINMLMFFYKFIQTLKLVPFIEFSGKHSLELFLVHPFIYHTIIPSYYSSLPPILIFTTAIVLSYTFSYVTYILKLIIINK